jgi:peptidoglycan/xylan/chitin deacetylase (PgdA/CDA1 family)
MGGRGREPFPEPYPSNGKGSLKKNVRIALFNLFNSAGVFDAWRYLHRKSVILLMLHGTADPGRPSAWRPLRPQISPEYLDWCLGEIGKFYSFISLEDAIGILTGRRPPVAHGISVTMDDGYRSNIKDALPVLRKHNAPTTIFLPVANIENRVPMWFDRLDYVLQSSDLEGNSFDLGGAAFRFSGNGSGGLASSYSMFRGVMKKQYAEEEAFYSKMEEVITFFERRTGRSLRDIFEDDPWSALLDWGEISENQGEYVRFGSHTMEHYRVDNLGEEALRYQLSESKKRIEERTGTRCRYIAYPNGDCSESAKNLALEAGYEAGVTTEEGINEVGCDPMELKRVSLPWTSDGTELLAHVSGLSNAMSFRRFVRSRKGERS